MTGDIPDRQMEVFRTLVIPPLDFREMSVRDAVEYLGQLTRKLAALHPTPITGGLQVLLLLPAGDPLLSRPISLSMADMSIGEAICRTAEAAGLVVYDFYEGLYLCPPPPKLPPSQPISQETGTALMARYPALIDPKSAARRAFSYAYNNQGGRDDTAMAIANELFAHQDPRRPVFLTKELPVVYLPAINSAGTGFLP